MTKMFLSVIAVVVITFTTLFTNPILAQTATWTKDLTAELVSVGWIEQSNDGMIIASGDKGLLGLDNNTGEISWHNKELKSVNKNSFQNIDGLPLFYVEYSALAGRTRGIIVNSSTGDILYDTKDDDYRIKTYHLIPEQGIILFEMTKENTRLLMSFSLKTWEKSWIADMGEIKGLIGKMGNKVAKQSFVDHGPMFTKSGDLVVGVNANVYCIDKASGSVKWNNEADKKINALVYSPLNNSIYMGVRKSKKLIVLDPANGNDITPGKLKLKGSLIDITSDSKNNIVLVETEGFNLIDPATNDLIWKKSYKIDYLDEVIPFDKGYIAIGKDEKDGSISYVDASGKKIWDTKVKGYTYYASTTKKGVIYISTERSNILSFDDGKDVWKKDVKFKSIPAVTYDDKEDKVVLFENGKAFKFDLTSGEMNIFAEDVALENVNKKTPLVAEYISEGYVVGTDQHISLISPSGKLLYTKYFKEVSSMDFTSLAQLGAGIAGVNIDIAGSMENIKALDRLSKGVYRDSNDAIDGTSKTSVAAGMYVGTAGNMTPVFEVTKTRYYNSKFTATHQYILTSDGGNQIAKVNKATGAVDMKIELKDKTPQYIVDTADKRIFLSEKNKVITCYQMK